MGRIEELSELYLRTISIPWGKSASGAERVLMAVYPTSLERTLRARVGLFADATAQSGHGWKLVDATTWFAEWMAGQEYAQSYFETPEDLRPLVEAEFKPHVAKRLRAELASAGPDDVVGLLGVASLYGFIRISELIRAVEPEIPGRLVVLFPGTKDGNNYRMLDAHDGWNYLANGISVSA